MPKKAEPNRGEASGHRFSHSSGSENGASPSLIRRFHSMRWSTMKVAPKNMVARIHLRAFFFLPSFAADTAKTIVRLLDRRTSVITVEKIMLGLNGNGVGHCTLLKRA